MMLRKAKNIVQNIKKRNKNVGRITIITNFYRGNRGRC